MPGAAIVGLQWGDEGKGKVLDALAGGAHVVVRYQGGGNAGHTVIVGGKRYVFHTVPTGILYPGVQCVVGNGTVIDVVALRQEVDDLRAQGVAVDGLRVSSRAHVVMPYHKALDEAREVATSSEIGTTKRGIGPCYADKAARTGIRMADLADPPRFAVRLRQALEEKNAILAHLFRRPPLEFGPIHDSCLEAARALAPFVTDTTPLVWDALDRGRRVLFEGAQGVMLDIDHGTYPFVTSSSASTAGIPSGAGVPPSAVGRVLGVTKAYTTRVGAGPFPSELQGDEGARLRELGHEYGATTGRARRCGWLDVVQLRYALRLTGTTEVVLTKLDALAGFGALRTVVAYERDGVRLDAPPAGEGAWQGLRTIVEDHEPIPAGAPFDGTTYDALPREARAYVERVEALLGVPITLVSTGPDRRALVARRAGYSLFEGGA